MGALAKVGAVCIFVARPCLTLSFPIVRSLHVPWQIVLGACLCESRAFSTLCVLDHRQVHDGRTCQQMSVDVLDSKSYRLDWYDVVLVSMQGNILAFLGATLCRYAKQSGSVGRPR